MSFYHRKNSARRAKKRGCGRRPLLLLSAALTVLFVMQATASLVLAANQLNETASGVTVVGADSSGTWEYQYTADSVADSYITGSVAGDKTGAVSSKVTFTNTNKNPAIVSFDYKVTTSGGSATLAGTAVTGNRSYKTTLQPTGSFTMVLATETGSSNSAKIEITNFSVLEIKTVTVTLKSSPYGSYTARTTNEAGETTTVSVAKDGADQTFSFQTSDGLDLAISSVDSGYSFSQWQDQAGKTLSEAASDNLKALDGGDTVELSILPTGVERVYKVGPAMYYYSWHDAVVQALDSREVIILRKDYTLPSNATEAAAKMETIGTYVKENADGGLTYTLPANVKLLIPYSDSDAGHFGTEIDHPSSSTSAAPKAFRTLTVPAGVTLDISGQVNVDAMISCVQPYETIVYQSYGCINLVGGMNLNSGSTLYCYGYIKGSGQVTALSGSHTYELMQICDWGGGTAASSWRGKTGATFYFSQYYVQNVEAAFTVHSGATTSVVLYVFASSSYNGVDTTFIGGAGSGLFQLASGSLTRRYDSATDRVTYNVYGDMTAKSINITVSGVTLNSANYVLGLNGNLTVNVNSGTTTIDSALALLPDSQINIKKDASVEIASGAKLYIWDVADWNGHKYVYSNTTMKPVYYSTANGTTAVRKAYTHSAKMVVDGTLTAAGNIYTTQNSSTSQDKVLTGSGTFVNTTSGTAVSLTEFTQSGSKITKETVTTVNVAGVLAGLTETGYSSFGAGTYYGLDTNGDGVGDTWYQSIIYLADTASQNGYALTTQTPCVGRQTGDDANVAGYTVNNVDFLFTVKPAADRAVWYLNSASDTKLKDEPVDGVFTIPGITEDTTVDFESYVARIVSNDGSSVGYATLKEAVDAYSTDSYAYIRVVKDITEDLTINKDVYLDLNGKTVTTNLTVAGDYKLYGMDSQTDGYEDNMAGRIVGTVSGSVAPVYETPDWENNGTFNRYVTIVDGSGTSFHRFNISIIGYRVVFVPNKDSALYFKATFNGDADVRENVSALGFILNGEKVIPEIDGAELTGNDVTLESLQALIDVLTAENCELPCTAEAYLTFDSGEQVSVTRELTFLRALKTSYMNGALKTTEGEDGNFIVDEFLKGNPAIKTVWDEIAILPD